MGGNLSSSVATSWTISSGDSGASNGRVMVPTLKELVATFPVLIVSTTVCGYCKIVKRLFSDLGTTVHSIELDIIPREQAKEAGALVAEVRAITKQTTVPQVFICGQWIGGCTETKLLLNSGRLEDILRNCCDGDIRCDKLRA